MTGVSQKSGRLWSPFCKVFSKTLMEEKGRYEVFCFGVRGCRAVRAVYGRRGSSPQSLLRCPSHLLRSDLLRADDLLPRAALWSLLDRLWNRLWYHRLRDRLCASRHQRSVDDPGSATLRTGFQRARELPVIVRQIEYRWRFSQRPQKTGRLPAMVCAVIHHVQDHLPHRSPVGIAFEGQIRNLRFRCL